MNDEIPEELKTWVVDFCEGRAHVNVGHTMFACKENMQNIKLENALNLIRTHKPLQEYVAGNDKRQRKLARFVAACVSNIVLKTFVTARYPGD